VQIGASVGALGFHGGGDGLHGLSRDHEVCEGALAASGFHRIRSGVWVGPDDALFHRSLALTETSPVGLTDGGKSSTPGS
jgi:hypothetical protein